MIKGIGVDIVEISEMKQLLHACDLSFLERTFTPREIACSKKRENPVEYLSGRFAVKEAFFKAVQPLIAENIDLRKVETLNYENGQPYINLSPLICRYMSIAKISRIHVSISAQNEYSIAFLVVEEMMCNG